MSTDRRSKTQTLGICALCAFFLAIATAAGCSSSTGAEQTTTQVPAAEDTGKDVSAKGKKWQGWRWQGDRDNCYFLVENTCHPTEEAACKAAECGDKKCEIEEGAPAKVSCRE